MCAAAGHARTRSATMGRRGKLQTLAEFAATRIVLDGARMLPRAAAVRAGQRIGRAAFDVASGLRRAGERNLRLAFPEMDEAERNVLLEKVFSNIGRLLGEFSHFPDHTRESLNEIVAFDEAFLDYSQAARAAKRGIILLTLHLGGWEISSLAHSALHHPLHLMVRPLDNPRVEALVEARRTRFGNVAVDKGSAMRRALRVLRDGGTLGILADVNVHPPNGIFVPFFGIQACTTTSVAALALRTGALVLPACAPFDEATNKYVVRALPPIDYEATGDEEHDIRRLTELSTRALETFVRRYPDQWLWIHKRWRTRPPGQPDLYARDYVPAAHVPERDALLGSDGDPLALG